MRITTRNARFQQWQALLTNRHKRQRAGEFLVQGVRPITLAVRNRWPVRALLYEDGGPLSPWARELLDGVDAPAVAIAPQLLRELSAKEDGGELVAVLAMLPDDLDRIPVRPDFLVVVFDRPTSPGNIGTLVRSADAFGAAGVVVTGHAADPYDPRAIRASTGSFFALPVVRARSHHEVLGWVQSIRSRGRSVQVVGTDEHASAEVAGADLRPPTLLLVGNETAGLSAAWRQACDVQVQIPITGSASSLNAATAGTVVLYEAARQRRPGPERPAASAP